MTEHTTTTVSDTTSSRGAQWAGAGSLIALAANSLFGGGSLGGILGGGNAAAQAANTAVAMELSEAKSKIAMLEQNAATRNALTTPLYEMDKRLGKLETEVPLLNKLTEAKIDSVTTLAQNGITTVTNSLAGLAATVANITKCVVPITAVCPQPMPQYNAWITPTQPTQAAAA